MRSAGVAAAVASLTFAASASAASGGASPAGGTSTSTTKARKNASTTGDSKHMGDRVLRMGMSGHDVRVLQDFLTLAGFPTAIDGQFGRSTKRNLIAFQRAKGMTPSGVVTFAVNRVLRAAVAAANPATTPAGHAVLNPSGTAGAPANAPAAVKAAIAAANRIAFTPYVFGGGHGSFNSRGYDCSGSVSYALHGAGVLSTPEDSSQLESYGSPGPGKWITIWANAGHAYMQIAGLFYDTAAQSGSNNSDRWSTRRASAAGGYVIRHPAGL